MKIKECDHCGSDDWIFLDFDKGTIWCQKCGATRKMGEIRGSFLICYVCGEPLQKDSPFPYCSEKCMNVMQKSRGFMCEFCESTNVFVWSHNNDGDHSSHGVLCNDCGQLIVNNREIRKGKPLCDSCKRKPGCDMYEDVMDYENDSGLLPRKLEDCEYYES